MDKQELNNDDKSKLVFQPVDFDPFSDNAPVQIPTTESQREIWTNIQISGHPASCAYNESVSLHLKGKLNVKALQEAVSILFTRHEALRSVFSEDGQSLIIQPHVSVEITLLDFTSLTEAEKQFRISGILDQEVEIEFDLLNGPLARISLIKTGEELYQLILSFHHIICDGWSLGIIMQDLSRIYSQIKNSGTYKDEPAASFVEFAKAENSYSESTEIKTVEKYWIDKFENDIPVLEIPLDKPRPVVRTFNAKRIDLPVDPNVIEALRKAGIAQGTSFVTTLLAAFEVFISRITGSEDVVIGLPAAGQAVEEKNNLVGHCVNLLPLRSKVDGTDTFNIYLKKRKSEILDAYDHQHFTFGSLINNLKIPRDPSRIPLLPVAFNIDLGLTAGVEFDGCTYSFSTNPRHYENFEIFINAEGTGNNINLECTFNTDLFDERMMQNRLEEFTVLLSGIADNPEQKILSLPLLSEYDKQVLQNNINPVQPRLRTITEWFNQTVQRFPDSVAVSDSNQNLTYRELQTRAGQLAALLLEQNVEKGSLIGICMDRNVNAVVSMIAILKAGCAYVPVDTNYPADRIAFILKDSNAPIVITDSKSIQLVSQSSSKIIDLDVQQPFTDKNIIHADVITDPDDTAYVIYTSGSTGIPKGTLINHGNVTRLFDSTNDWFGFSENDVWTLFHSIAFDFSVWEIYGALFYGGRIVIVPYLLSRDPDEFYSLLKKEKVTVLNQTPSAFKSLIQADQHAMEKVSSLRYIIFGGEALETASLSSWVETHGIHSPHLINMYGITETTVHVTYRPVSVEDVESPKGSMIGVPIPDLSIRILDDYMQSVPLGVRGSMYIGGAGVASGYLNRPELTADRFVMVEEERLYESGDLARYHYNGDIEYLGRIDHQVKIRGFRIELGEIESRIEKHPDVIKQFVTVREDEPGNKKIVAYLEWNQNNVFDAHYFREFLKNDLPEYMIPSVIMPLDKIPLTTNGKIDKKALPVPEATVNITYEEPKTPVEETLANIWCDLLRIDKVGRKDNFFELGGHSLIGVQMFNEVKKKLGVKIKLSVLFTAPTIEELARVINKEGSLKPWSCLVPLQEKGNKTPLFCIHMHNGNVYRWRVLVKHLGNDQPLYAIQPLGHNSDQTPHKTIEEMARYYINVLKEVQPHGPYKLLGLCFSGMVVFEMAALLEQQGESVSFLGMVNNYAPPENPMMYRVKTGLNKFMKMELGEKFNYAIEKNLDFGKKIFGIKKSAAPENGTEVIDRNSGYDEAAVGHDLRTIHSLALLNYHPAHIYHGSLVIIRSDEPIADFYEEDLGWKRLVKGDINVHVIYGCDNDTIITDEPYNAELSLIVKQYIENQ
jgi:amino acid adenylation domain-containing protein